MNSPACTPVVELVLDDVVDDVELVDAGATGGRAFITNALGAVESTRSTVMPLMDGEHLSGLMEGDKPTVPTDADGVALQAMENVAAQYTVALTAHIHRPTCPHTRTLA